MRLIIKITLLFLLNNISAFSQSNSLFLSTDKVFYNSTETISYTISQTSFSCVGTTTAYLELLNSKLKIVHQQILRLSDIETKFQLPLIVNDSGYFLLRVYTQEQAKLNPSGIKQIAIGVNIPIEKQTQNRSLQIFLYPEGGRALVNFKNRFAFYVQTQNGMPVQEKLFVRNKAGQLIALCTTDAGGWGMADIPIVEKEIISIQPADGKVLHTINAETGKDVSNTGFSLRTETDRVYVNVEMRKAEGEQIKKTVLEVYYKDVLLYDAPGLFRDDTTIVETSFAAKGFENKLLRLLLKDENGSIVSERLAFVPGSITDTGMSQVKAEIFCETEQHFAIKSEDFLSDKINDRLNALNIRRQDRTDNEKEGFSLFFLNKEIAGQTLNYSIINSENKILQMGVALADSTGVLEINNYTFKGRAFVQFYLNGKQVRSYTKILPLSLSFNNDELAFQQMAWLAFGNDSLKPNEKISEMKNTAANEMQSNEKELAGVTVVGTIKPRMVELEEKYVQNGMFKDFNSTNINVEDDGTATNYKLIDYLIRKIPGLFMRREKIKGVWKEVIMYRMGYVDFFIDEVAFDSDPPNFSMGDIGYIKFFRNPVRGGMVAEKGGQLIKSGSGFAGGLQGSVVIYTKKYSGGNINNSTNGLQVTGFVNE